MYKNKINALISYLNSSQKKSYINEHIELIRYAMAISDDKDQTLEELTKFLSVNFHMIYLDELIMNIVNETQYDIEKKECYFDCIYLFDKANSADYQGQNGLWNKTSFKMQLYKYDCSKIDDFCLKLENELSKFSKKISEKRFLVAKYFCKSLCNKLNEIKQNKKIPYIHFIDLELLEDLGRSPVGLAHDLSHMFVTGAGNKLYDYKNDKKSPIILTDLMPKLLKGQGQEYMGPNNNKIKIDKNFLTNYDIVYWSVLSVINSIFKDVLYVKSNTENSITDSKNIEYLKEHLEGLEKSNDPDIYSQYVDIINNSKVMSSPMYDSDKNFNPNFCIEKIEYKEGGEKITEDVLNIECVGNKIFENQIGFQKPLLKLILSEDFVSGETGDFINDILGNLFLKKDIKFNKIEFKNINVLIKSTNNKEVSDREQEKDKNKIMYKPNSYLSAKNIKIDNEDYLNSYFINFIIDKILYSKKFINSFGKSLEEVMNIIINDNEFETEKKEPLKDYIDELLDYNIIDFKEYMDKNIIYDNGLYNVKKADADLFALKIEENATKINDIFTRFDKIKKYIEPFINKYNVYDKVKESFFYIEKELKKDYSSSVFNFSSNDFFPNTRKNDFLSADPQGRNLLYILNLKQINNTKNSEIRLSKVISKYNEDGKKEAFYFKESILKDINKKIDNLNKLLKEFKEDQENKSLYEDFMMHILRRKLYSYELEDDALKQASRNNKKHEKDEKYFYNYKKIFKNLNKDDEDKFFLKEYLSNYFFTFERLLLKNKKEIDKREAL